MIASTFEQIGVFLMPSPGNQLARNTNFDIRTVDKDFLEQVKKFVPMIFDRNSIVCKTFGGSFLTGSELVKLVEKWSELFNSDEMPESKNVYQASAEIYHKMAKQTAIDYYTMEMKLTVDGRSDQQFDSSHRY